VAKSGQNRPKCRNQWQPELLRRFAPIGYELRLEIKSPMPLATRKMKGKVRKRHRAAASEKSALGLLEPTRPWHDFLIASQVRMSSDHRQFYGRGAQRAGLGLSHWIHMAAEGAEEK
jgi:hypothetical protein